MARSLGAEKNTLTKEALQAEMAETEAVYILLQHQTCQRYLILHTKLFSKLKEEKTAKIKIVMVKTEMIYT